MRDRPDVFSENRCYDRRKIKCRDLTEQGADKAGVGGRGKAETADRLRPGRADSVFVPVAVQPYRIQPDNRAIKRNVRNVEHR